MALQLYTHPMSPCSQKVRIVLAEKGLAWEKIDVDLPAKANLEAAYLKLNPLGVVPTLVADGKAVIESSIICEYLEDCYPEPRLKPADAWQISRMRYWMKHVDNKVHPSCGALQWPLVMADKLRTLPSAEQDRIVDQIPEKPRRERQRRLLKLGYDAPDVVEAIGVYDRTFAELDNVLATQAWIAGDSFSLADASMAPYLQTPYQFGWRGWYERYSHLTEWYARCRARASYESAVAADFSTDKLIELGQRGAPAWDKIQAVLAASSGPA